MTWGDDIAAKLLGSSVPAGFQKCLSIWEAPTAACPLVDLATLRDALGITDPSQYGELSRVAGAYSMAIENYCERQFCKADREVVFAARGFCNVPFLLVPQWPIITITSLVIDGTDVDPTAWFDDSRGGKIYSTASTGWQISQYALLKYSSGYETIPPDLTDAIIQMSRSAMQEIQGGGEVGPLKLQRVEGAVTEQYYDSRTTSASSSTSGAVDIGQYSSTLDYYRSERAFI